MNTKPSKPGRLRALAASALLIVGGTFSAGLITSTPAAADAPATSEETANFEVDFLKNMIDHHSMAIMSAQTCLEKADHQELESLCQSIIDSQSSQIEQMQTWLQDWYGISYEAQPGNMQSMQSMENVSSAQYEIQFMQSMIEHHRGAVQEAESCLANAGHEPLLGLCTDIRQSQLEEIDQMQAWLDTWYNVNAADGAVSPMPKGGADTGVTRDSNSDNPTILALAGGLLLTGAAAVYVIRRRVKATH